MRKTYELLDALKELKNNQVLVQINNVAEGYGYNQSGTTVHWGEENGMLEEYYTGVHVLIGKPVEGDEARYIIKHKSEIEPIKLLEAMDIMEEDEVMIQVTDTSDFSDFDQLGTTLEWREYDGVLANYHTGTAAQFGKRKDSITTYYIIRNKEEWENEQNEGI